jgi:aminoglycoside phosphotransferase family enzyme/predicted kinase
LTLDEVQEAVARAGRRGRPGRVEVRETHISWVFLTRDSAYKLKKPLVLPFLDYGTPEQRHRMCAEEVRLNRRLAPDLYRGVVSLVPGNDRLMLAAEDDPGAVDYMVEMERYDEHGTLATMLERGELTPARVTALADVLARFHAQAERIRPTGLPILAAERRQAENFHELLSVAEQRAEIDRTLSLERFMHAFLVAHGGTLDRRARTGMVRDVHGDLRAEHVLMGPPVAILDCIEFDPALRQIDVADDLAFLVMDMTSLGASRHAWGLVEAYRKAGGDPGSDSLIAFHAAYRAQVRAKVALLRAAQHSPESGAHGAESARARDLLGLAETFAWRARRPLVLVVCGLPAAGKSHLATALARASGLPHLSSDVTRKRLAGVRSHEAAPDLAYQEQFNRLTYAELGRRAAAEVTAVGGAVLDATFRRREDRHVFAAAFAHATPVLFVECVAPAQVRLQRAAERERRPGVSDASAAVVRRESDWDGLDEAPAAAHLVLRTDRPVGDQLADLLAWLDRRV